MNSIYEMNFTPEEFKNFKLLSGDILLNEGQSLELVGRAAIYRNELPGACFTNTLVRFRPHADIPPEYALIYFGSSGDRVGENAGATSLMAHVGKGFRDFRSPQILVRFRNGQIKQA